MSLDFSVIIPTYDRPEALENCLESLTRSKFPVKQFEVIVVDDGTVPPLLPVLRHFERSLQIRGLRQSRQGPAAARNHGARAADGRFLAFTDDDCLPDPGWLEAYRKIFAEDETVLAGGRTVNALQSNPYATASQVIQDLVYAYYNPDPENARFFASNNMAVSRAGFHAVGGFHAGFRTSEDRELCARWIRTGRRLRYVPDAVVRHAHRLTLWKFWKQHFCYGRGAARFYKTQKQASRSSSTIETGFYTFCLRCLPMLFKREKGGLALMALLGVWQLANTAGFFFELPRIPNETETGRRNRFP